MKADLENHNPMAVRLKDARQAKGMTQKELHEESGVSITVISNIENGSRRITRNIATLLAYVLDVDAEYLLCETEHKNATEYLDKREDLGCDAGEAISQILSELDLLVKLQERERRIALDVLKKIANIEIKEKIE